MSVKLGRRRLVGAGLAAAAALPFAALFSRRAAAADYGPLLPDPRGIFELPEGFTYTVLETAGDSMSDGYLVPGRPDGMGCFAGPDGTLVLMRNHELSPGALGSPYKPGELPPVEAYDPVASGGVSRLVVDPQQLVRISSNLVLAGTTRNCAGGHSPWGWMSCEETTTAGHGYVFACFIDADTVDVPHRLPSYGRFNHEAAVVDPRTHIAYLTEDRNNGCFYRFLPDVAASPFVGKLQALKIVGEEQTPLTNAATQGETFAVEWVDIDEPDPLTDTVRLEAKSKGAAVVNRGEGIYLHNGEVYFACTEGGPAGAGQIFKLDPANDTLTLVGVSTNANLLHAPDNLVVAPWGDIVIAEDSPFGNNHLRVMRQDGTLFELGRNAQGPSELAGVCFSPDGSILFVNIQEKGLTLAITGPFRGAGAGGSGGAGGAAGAGGTSSSSGEPVTPIQRDALAGGAGCGAGDGGRSGSAGAALVGATVAGVAVSALARRRKRSDAPNK